MIKYSLLLVFLLVFCTNKKEVDCKDQGIKIEYLSDMDKLIQNGYVCDKHFEDFGIDELKRCKVVFSDSNYKILYNGFRSRVLFDKKENLKLAVNSLLPDFRPIKNRPFSLYILNDKLMPVYGITKFGVDSPSVFKIEYKNNKIILLDAVDKESKNIDVNKLTYQQILLLISKIKNTFKYKLSEGTLDDYFYKVPYWTEGRE
ncbi:hypothetical protein [Flavobacterium hungaricum]|jgi:hypothetical protein|uniref:Lipoprotein n=1 Tax=Flavobacterium hungaricum TaxID=2082725 RepID=A0ABR9TE82_9FLAO|nr:hypothetical protein [Flavobacterium hungaricum]MBE8723364.1 hypothetical protein [Flavobacterium hungaricum]